jgi:hypothetical protein
MSLAVRVHHRPKKLVEIKFNDELSSPNNPKGSTINLGYVRGGSHLFTLAGSGTDTHPFVSTNPPTVWMQSTLDTIGSKWLREISMPASHDSGMSEVTGLYGGVKHNTLTQTFNVFDQLRLGARYLDMRPVSFRRNFWTGHFQKGTIGAVGCSGRSLNKIVADINRFTDLYPGELIIIDISHDMNSNNMYKPFTINKWQNLYKVLNQINDLWIPTSDDIPVDLSTLPLSSFITPGSRSSVLIRLPNRAPPPDSNFSKREYEEYEVDATIDSLDQESLPFHTEFDLLDAPSTPVISPAFINENRLPQTGWWANARTASALTNDQLAKLSMLRNSSTDEMHRSIWTITQMGHYLVDVGVRRHSIIGFAKQAHRALYAQLWPNMTSMKWPNLIEVDDIRDLSVASLCMTINRRFVNPDPVNVEVEVVEKRSVFYNYLCRIFPDGCKQE